MNDETRYIRQGDKVLDSAWPKDRGSVTIISGPEIVVDWVLYREGRRYEEGATFHCSRLEWSAERRAWMVQDDYGGRR
jgi:hypothetical protein